MGLTKYSVGKNAVDTGLLVRRQSPRDRVVALAGNPNVGKSTLFNALTGMNQHTGNWPGKTVTNAQGRCESRDHSLILVDIPGTYSLMAHSAEEEVARDFICFGEPDAVIVVCDATCLERNLNLVLQTMEICPRVVVCVNLMDEAARKEIRIDLQGLSRALGVPVVGTTARRKKTLSRLTDAVDRVLEESPRTPLTVRYAPAIEKAAETLTPVLQKKTGGRLAARWLALRLLEEDPGLAAGMQAYFGRDLLSDPQIFEAVRRARNILTEAGFLVSKHAPAGKARHETGLLQDSLVQSLILTAETVCADTVCRGKGCYSRIDRRIDRILTSRLTGYPVMLLLLALIFWLTISGANAPSELLSHGLFWLQDRLLELASAAGFPSWLSGVLILGAYRVLAWVVSVMLPPMAIFFPLFTLLEDAGYLPRVAYNLDRPFHKCSACGKQALTMCMGFGCNAAGVVGCRIIDSPRERLIAVLTNNFVPCNGRFPTLISLITVFFVGTAGGLGSSVLSALMLTAVIVFGIFMTFVMSRLLSKTVLKGVPSSFTLELPPYRRPQIGRVIVRSMLDRTLFVLSRAAAVAAPAGVILWLMANCTVGGTTLLSYCAGFLDPFARLLGLDGVILLAFILGFPANEIVLPIMLMAYLCKGSILELSGLDALRTVLVQNGWTPVTAVCVMLFSLMHWPCSTTLLTIRKETGSLRWTLLSAALPTAAGMFLCAGIHFLFG